MERGQPVFQISGIKNHEKKRVLVEGMKQLGAKYRGGSVYCHACTHLIVPHVLSSEKFLAACAAGKWVLTPDYVSDSVKNGSWLAEEPYEVAIFTGSTSTFYPVRQWRKKVATGSLKGAFQDWRVVLMVQEPARRAMFKRLLKAGRAKVYRSPPPSHAAITHIIAKPVTENLNSHSAPCLPVSHIVQHLFGNTLVEMDIMEDHPVEMGATDAEGAFSHLETKLRDYAIKQEGRPRLCFLNFLGYHDPYCPQSQATETDFSNAGSLIECGLFTEALDSIRSAVFPGVLPPLSYLSSLLEYAQQGNATSVFLRNLQQVMCNLLVSNPPWLASSAVKKYFTKLLQCPRCKAGTWPFLETAISYCLSSEVTCHSLPGPTLPILLRFHSDILAFFLKIFQGELYSVSAADVVAPHERGGSQASASGSLLNGTFWTVWEHATLLSRAVKQLTRLLIQAATQDFTEKYEKRDLRLADTLVNYLSVLVEFWCQQHFRLNQSLMEKGLKDLAEYFAVNSHDVSPLVLAEVVVRISSCRLKLVIADAIFRNLCCRNGVSVGDEPLSLRKMVQSYLPALGHLAQSPSGVHPKIVQDPSCRIPSPLVNTTNQEKENLPRGLNIVNTAGETLLHRACKRNQVETVLQILALPGTDVNVKDHAGWTPLHEACNHGSTVCVEALLRHHPAPVLNYQVGGISPLHDALLNGYMDIAKMLLEHAGSVLLQQTDHIGRTALDLVFTADQREELHRSAQVGDSALTSKATKVFNLPLLEAGSVLLAHFISSYLRERGLHSNMQANNNVHRLIRSLETHSFQRVTLGWTDQRAVRMVEDVETLLEIGRGRYLGHIPQSVKECKGENTMFLMEMMGNLKMQAEALATDV